MQHTIHAVIRSGEQSGFVAECSELNAVTQGSSLDEVVDNLREVVGLALEGEDLSRLGYTDQPTSLTASWLPRRTALTGAAEVAHWVIRW